MGIILAERKKDEKFFFFLVFLLAYLKIFHGGGIGREKSKIIT